MFSYIFNPSWACEETDLTNFRFRIRLTHPLPQTGRIQLQQTTIASNELQIPLNCAPHCRPLGEAPLDIVALEPDEVEMSDDGRLQRSDHLELRVKIIHKQPLVRPTRLVSSLEVRLRVEVDRNAVNMMDGANEEVKLVLFQQSFDPLPRPSSDPVDLHPDQDRDPRSILVA